MLAVAVAAYALLVLLMPGFGPPFIAELRSLVPTALSAHLVGGLAALAVGPWQMNSRLRAGALGRHRWLGRVSQVAGIPFADAYQAVAWVCWVPNVVVAEWLVLRRQVGPREQQRS